MTPTVSVACGLQRRALSRAAIESLLAQTFRAVRIVSSRRARAARRISCGVRGAGLAPVAIGCEDAAPSRLAMRVPPRDRRTDSVMEQTYQPAPERLGQQVRTCAASTGRGAGTFIQFIAENGTRGACTDFPTAPALAAGPCCSTNSVGTRASDGARCFRETDATSPRQGATRIELFQWRRLADHERAGGIVSTAPGRQQKVRWQLQEWPPRESHAERRPLLT